jgi:HD-like signal output (HDOD) protein
VRPANEQLCGLVSRDQFLLWIVRVLTADMLRIAQSATYKGVSEIHSIDEALVRLGLRRASDLFFRAAMESKMFKCGGGEAIFERLRKHSVATAELSRLVCRQTSLFDDSAYLCGLLHDVGIAGCMLAIGCERRSNPKAQFEAHWPAIRQVHARFATHIAVLWDLPQELRLVLTHHLEFERTMPVHPMAAVTYFAEALANKLNLGFADENEGHGIEKAVRELRISDKQLAYVESEAKRLMMIESAR